METASTFGIERIVPAERIQHELWPLDDIDPKKAKFPCCLVWTPLPVVSWLAPFIGHVGICREDGTILDFSGSYLINTDNFAFGAVARYYQLDRKQVYLSDWAKLLSFRFPIHFLQYNPCCIYKQCCFPPNLAGHTCKCRYKHIEYGTAITWDDGLLSSTRHFEHQSYNLFTCNSHSFIANCLNRLCYGGSMGWNMVNVAGLVLIKGCWVNSFAVLKSFFPFIVVLCFGLAIVGWPFLIALSSFSLLLLGWFLFATYCVKGLLEI